MQFENKFYFRIEDGYIVDVIRYNRDNYVFYGISTLPDDIMCGCYKIIDGELVLDQEKYDLLGIEVDNYDNE
jgi:hypothetical protein